MRLVNTKVFLSAYTSRVDSPFAYADSKFNADTSTIALTLCQEVAERTLAATAAFIQWPGIGQRVSRFPR